MSDARRPDLGPRVVLQRGERVETQVPDLDRPHVRGATVRAARVHCAVRVMAGRAHEQERQAWADRVAAKERYARAAEIVRGASEGAPERLPEVRAGGGSVGVSERALMASETVTRARARMRASLGLTGVTVLDAVCIAGLRTEDIAPMVGCGRDATSGYIVAMLDVLVRAIGGVGDDVA